MSSRRTSVKKGSKKAGSKKAGSKKASSKRLSNRPAKKPSSKRSSEHKAGSKKKKVSKKGSKRPSVRLSKKHAGPRKMRVKKEFHVIRGHGKSWTTTRNEVKSVSAANAAKQVLQTVSGSRGHFAVVRPGSHSDEFATVFVWGLDADGNKRARRAGQIKLTAGAEPSHSQMNSLVAKRRKQGNEPSNSHAVPATPITF